MIGIPIPRLCTQSDIVEKIKLMKASTSRLERCYLDKLEELVALKRSLLQRAFSGELAEVETVAA